MFSRRWIINYVLMVLIIVFTYIGNRYSDTSAEQAHQRISGLKPADVKTLEIQTANTSLSLRRDNNGWLLEAPISWSANNIIIERLLNILNSDVDSRLPASEINLATVGLQFPQAMLRFNETQLVFGATNNIGKRRYIMVDSTVFLTADVHLPFFSQGLVSIVDRRLIPPRYPLRSITLPQLEISRDSSGTWQTSGSDNFTQDQLAGIVRSWQEQEASKIKPYDANMTPRQKLLIGLGDGSQLEYFVMSIEPEIIIAHPQIGLQYHFPADLYYQLISLNPDEAPA